MLMIEQFRNQDPFQPMENGEFIAQMAQFSQVAGIAEMNDSMKDLAGSIGASQALQASTMVGRSVLADGNVATLGSDTPLKGGVEPALWHERRVCPRLRQPGPGSPRYLAGQPTGRAGHL